MPKHEFIVLSPSPTSLGKLNHHHLPLLHLPHKSFGWQAGGAISDESKCHGIFSKALGEEEETMEQVRQWDCASPILDTEGKSWQSWIFFTFLQNYLFGNRKKRSQAQHQLKKVSVTSPSLFLKLL